MIFVTVGAQMAFDRLVRGVDDWAGARGRRDVFAQVGPSAYRPRHIDHSRFIDPLEFRRNVEQADAVVAHAGMGSIISALECGKPILVMPRRGDLGETRNDHQVATAERFSAMQLVHVATDEQDLFGALDRLVGITVDAARTGRPATLRWAACPFDHSDAVTTTGGNLPDSACPHLLAALTAFLAGRLPFEINSTASPSVVAEPVRPRSVGVNA